MLVEFRLRNYSCFRDEQVLSLVASSDASLPNNTIEPPGNFRHMLLRSAVIYGPNASGKTTLLTALAVMRSFVVNSVKPDDPIPVVPYLLDRKNASAPSAFEITFIYEGIRYQYGFSADRTRVHGEYMYYAPRGVTVLLFRRAWNAETGEEEYEWGASLRGQKQQIRAATRENALFLNKAADSKHDVLSKPYEWFARKLSGYQGYIEPVAGTTSDADHDAVRGLLVYADLGIADFRLTPIPASELDASRSVGLKKEGAQDVSEPRVHKVEMLHSSPGSEPVAFPLAAESRGTAHLFRASGPLLRALNQGRVLVADELDASLHPALVRKLVELFQNPDTNKCDAQLIFNTHDTALLDGTIFRRDQVWFTEKDADGAAHLYPLLEYSPRKGEALAKGYLQGRYGAIPFLGDVSTLFEVRICHSFRSRS